MSKNKGWPSIKTWGSKQNELSKRLWCGSEKLLWCWWNLRRRTDLKWERLSALRLTPDDEQTQEGEQGHSCTTSSHWKVAHQQPVPAHTQHQAEQCDQHHCTRRGNLWKLHFYAKYVPCTDPLSQYLFAIVKSSMNDYIILALLGVTCLLWLQNVWNTVYNLNRTVVILFSCDSSMTLFYFF